MFSRITGLLKMGFLAVLAWFSFRSGKQGEQVKQQRQEAVQQEELKEVVLDAKEINADVDQLDSDGVNQRLRENGWFRD